MRESERQELERFEGRLRELAASSAPSRAAARWWSRFADSVHLEALTGEVHCVCCLSVACTRTTPIPTAWLVCWDSVPERVLLARDAKAVEEFVYRAHDPVRGTTRHWTWRPIRFRDLGV